MIAFFFQAEDGIRGGHVTGVQTCALPISAAPAGPGGARAAGGIQLRVPGGHQPPRHGPPPAAAAVVATGCVREPTGSAEEIGRASCREREHGLVEAAVWE